MGVKRAAISFKNKQELIQRLRKNDTSKEELASEYHISSSSVYGIYIKYIKDIAELNKNDNDTKCR